MKTDRKVDGGGDLFSALNHQKTVTQRMRRSMRRPNSSTSTRPLRPKSTIVRFSKTQTTEIAKPHEAKASKSKPTHAILKIFGTNGAWKILNDESLPPCEPFLLAARLEGSGKRFRTYQNGHARVTLPEFIAGRFGPSELALPLPPAGTIRELDQPFWYQEGDPAPTCCSVAMHTLLIDEANQLSYDGID